MTYSSVIYKLDRRTKKGKNIASTGDIAFPQRLPFSTLADLMVRGQAVCFKDGNLENENANRIVDMFKRKSTEQPTMAVIISLGYLEDEGNIFSANDMGILTVQRGEMSLMTSDVIPGNEKVLWINEVCRSLFDKEKVPRSDGPIPKIMHQAEQYARMQGDKMIFLMVEKQPEHGDGNVLLQYYSTGYKGRGGYGYMIVGEDAEYWFMGKDLSISSVAQAPQSPVMETVIVEEPVVTPSPRMHESNMERFETDLEMVPEAGAVKPRKTRHRRHHKKHHKTKKHKKKHHKTKKHKKSNRKHKKHHKSRKHKKGGFGDKPGVGIKSGVLVRIYTGKEGEVLTNPQTWEGGWTVDVVMHRSSIVRKGIEEKTIENIHIKPQGLRARLTNKLFGKKTQVGYKNMFQ